MFVGLSAFSVRGLPAPSAVPDFIICLRRLGLPWHQTCSATVAHCAASRICILKSLTGSEAQAKRSLEERDREGRVDAVIAGARN
jgi:hypothetical protein